MDQYRGIPTSWHVDAPIHLINIGTSSLTQCGLNPFKSRGVRAWEDLTSSGRVNCPKCLGAK